MSEHKCKALILDSDADALIVLQRTLENGGVDTTITWDNAEARNLARSTPFDVMLIGDHPPEISADTTVLDLRLRGVISPCLILRTTAREMDTERLRRLGVINAVPKRDPDRVLEEVQGTCGFRRRSMTDQHSSESGERPSQANTKDEADVYAKFN